MRTPTLGSVQYAIGMVPDKPEDMQRFLQEELLKIQTAINALSLGHVDKTTVAPTKPREGDFRFADGTSWNPGAGAGFYGYHSAAWNKF